MIKTGSVTLIGGIKMKTNELNLEELERLSKFGGSDTEAPEKSEESALVASAAITTYEISTLTVSISSMTISLSALNSCVKNCHKH